MINDIYQGKWHKSLHSGGGTNDCVEVAVTDTRTGVRDTKNRRAGMLEIPAASWSAFVSHVNAGELRS